MSLLNADVDIFTGVLAGQLEWVVPTVVPPDQTRFVGDRQTFFHVKRLLGVLCVPSPPDCTCDEVIF